MTLATRLARRLSTRWDVDRNETGRIVGAWEDPQRTGQELLPIDSAELQEFLAQPVARFDCRRLTDIVGHEDGQAWQYDYSRRRWWALHGSNVRHHPCNGYALPLS